MLQTGSLICYFEKMYFRKKYELTHSLVPFSNIRLAYDHIVVFRTSVQNACNLLIEFEHLKIYYFK